MLTVFRARSLCVAVKTTWGFAWIDELGALSVQIGPVVVEWDHTPG